MAAATVAAAVAVIQTAAVKAVKAAAAVKESAALTADAGAIHTRCYPAQIQGVPRIMLSSYAGLSSLFCSGAMQHSGVPTGPTKHGRIHGYFNRCRSEWVTNRGCNENLLCTQTGSS